MDMTPENVADELKSYLPFEVHGAEPEDKFLQVRLQADPGEGWWHTHSGDSGYDTDHTGHWGAGHLHNEDTEQDLRETAADLIEQVEESYAAQKELSP